MTAPLRIELDVECPVEHAFTVWTSRFGDWWPADHTVTGRADLDVVLQGRVGGRIYERTPEGAEHDWGQVTQWRPPSLLGYRWHLGRAAGGAADGATDVLIRFLPRGERGTRIEIEHTGWERLGAEADRWRDRNQHGWNTLLPHYLDYLGFLSNHPTTTNGEH